MSQKLSLLQVDYRSGTGSQCGSDPENEAQAPAETVSHKINMLQLRWPGILAVGAKGYHKVTSHYRSHIRDLLGGGKTPRGWLPLLGEKQQRTEQKIGFI